MRIVVNTRRAPAGGSDAKPLDGVWACTNCNNIEAGEREVACWYCGKGEMIWFDHNAVAAALRLYRGPREIKSPSDDGLPWEASQ